MKVESTDKLPTWLPPDFGFRKHIRTHVSEVYIGKELVFKLKRALCYPFVDHRSFESRLASARAEVELNCRLSHGVYRGLHFLLGAGGDVVLSELCSADSPVPEGATDVLVCMNRLEDRDCLAQLLHTLPEFQLLQGVEAIAAALAEFHQSIPTSQSTSVPQFLEAIDETAESLVALAKRVDWLPQHRLARIIQMQQLRTAELLPLLHARESEGLLRDGHGDLRPDHIYFQRAQSGQAQSERLEIIDCLEFSSALRAGDVLRDLSFLLMELDMSDRSDLSAHLYQSWAQRFIAGASDALLPYYKTYYALVRAKVEGFQIVDSVCPVNQSRVTRLIGQAQRYLLQIRCPQLVLVSGPMGVGKSTLAQGLVGELNAQYLRSDAVRDELFSRSDTAEGFGSGRYEGPQRLAVYQELARRAEELLLRGLLVVVDATFSNHTHCELFESLAKRVNVPLTHFSCRASEETLVKRLTYRSALGEDISEGRVSLLRSHLRDYQWPQKAVSVDLEREVSSELFVELFGHLAR